MEKGDLYMNKRKIMLFSFSFSAVALILFNYSLGNFIFTKSNDPRGSESVMVNIEFTNNHVSSSVTPAKIIEGQPKLMNTSYNKSIINKLNKLSNHVKIDSHGNVLQK